MIGTNSPAAAGRRGSPAHLAGLLVAVVVDPDGGLEMQTDDKGGCLEDELLTFARLNKVDGSLAVAFGRSRRSVPHELELVCRRASLVHLQVARALGVIAEALDERGIRWAVVKGPAMSRLWPHGSITRTYDDLDILVSPCDLPAATEALERLGFEHRNHNWRGFVDFGVAEIPLDDGTVVVDLHWNLVALSEQRRYLRLDTSAMLDRSEVTELSGHMVPVLCDLDAFTHICCHAALAGARDLRTLHDVHLLARRVDVDDARRSLQSAGCARLAAPVIDRAVRWFGPVTSGDGRQFRAEDFCDHRRWIALNRMADRLWSACSRRHRYTYPGAIVESGRPGVGATLRALCDRVVVGSRSRLGLRTPTSQGGHLHWETGDRTDPDAGVERYMRYVWDEGRCG